MIKANELRVGNLVNSTQKRHNEVFVKVETIGLETINTDFRAYNLEYLEPIPLTVEILLKCGFEIKNWGIKIYYNPMLDLDSEFRVRGIDYNIKIKHVHQLQNLYFALTGEELEVNI